VKILALVLALAGVARADELSDLHDDYARSQRRVSIALLSGGLASIAIGGALLGGGPSDQGWYVAGAVTIVFGAIDAMLGGMALPGLKKSEAKWRDSKTQRRDLFEDAGRMTVAYGVNLGLDVGYVMAGAAALLAGLLGAPSSHSWIGGGAAAMVGGAFLIGVDTAGLLGARKAQRGLMALTF
jgi:hypothetical protein